MWSSAGPCSHQHLTQSPFRFLALLDFNCSVQREEYDSFIAYMHRCDHLLDPHVDLLANTPLLARCSSAQIRRFSVSNKFSNTTAWSPGGTAPSLEALWDATAARGVREARSGDFLRLHVPHPGEAAERRLMHMLRVHTPTRDSDVARAASPVPKDDLLACGVVGGRKSLFLRVNKKSGSDREFEREHHGRFARDRLFSY